MQQSRKGKGLLAVVTGGAGFIGSHLVDRLLAEGHRVRAVDPMPLHFGKKITGRHGGGARPSANIPRLVRLARSGRLRLDRRAWERSSTG